MGIIVYKISFQKYKWCDIKLYKFTIYETSQNYKWRDIELYKFTIYKTSQNYKWRDIEFEECFCVQKNNLNVLKKYFTWKHIFHLDISTNTSADFLPIPIVIGRQISY